MLQEIGLLIVKSFWFMLPAYIANMSPYAVKNIKFLSQPISEKYLGTNKTWRGFLFAILVAITIVCIQSFFTAQPEYLVYDYSNPLLLGFLLGSGAMIGDLVKSFFKRRVGIAPGKSWMPFDQIDFIIGAYLFSLLIIPLQIEILIALLAITIPAHLITNYIGYKLKIKKSKF
jgi:CDP-2,3-bis-(O-geranylgeranyl)-sn-glycerol synthase